jgi:hypothetical protein
MRWQRQHQHSHEEDGQNKENAPGPSSDAVAVVAERDTATQPRSTEAWSDGNTATRKTHLPIEKRRPDGSPTECLRQRVEAFAADLAASETAVCEQEAIITQLQRSYNQQRCDLRAQLGLGPDEDDAEDVRHARKVQDLQRQVSAVETTMHSAAPDLDRYDGDVAAAKQARDALAAENLDTTAAIKAVELRHERLQNELPNIRSQCSQQESQLRTQQTKLAEMEATAIRAQEKREAAKEAAAANKLTASCGSTDAAESLLDLLRSRLAGKPTTSLRHAIALHSCVVRACVCAWRSRMSVCVRASMCVRACVRVCVHVRTCACVFVCCACLRRMRTIFPSAYPCDYYHLL